jgi:hypothetical protein
MCSASQALQDRHLQCGTKLFFTTLAAEAAEDALVEILGETLQAAEEQTHPGAAQTAV